VEMLANHPAITAGNDGERPRQFLFDVHPRSRFFL